MVRDMKCIFLSFFVNNVSYPKLIVAFTTLNVFTPIIIRK